MGHGMRHLKSCLIFMNYWNLVTCQSHFYEVLECDIEWDTLSISNYSIFCLIFLNYLNLGTCRVSFS
jgi:hypothetical protein